MKTVASNEGLRNLNPFLMNKKAPNKILEALV